MLKLIRKVFISYMKSLDEKICDLSILAVDLSGENLMSIKIVRKSATEFKISIWESGEAVVEIPEEGEIKQLLDKLRILNSSINSSISEGTFDGIYTVIAEDFDTAAITNLAEEISREIVAPLRHLTCSRGLLKDTVDIEKEMSEKAQDSDYPVTASEILSKIFWLRRKDRNDLSAGELYNAFKRFGRHTNPIYDIFVFSVGDYPREAPSTDIPIAFNTPKMTKSPPFKTAVIIFNKRKQRIELLVAMDIYPFERVRMQAYFDTVIPGRDIEITSVIYDDIVKIFRWYFINSLIGNIYTNSLPIVREVFDNFLEYCEFPGELSANVPRHQISEDILNKRPDVFEWIKHPDFSEFWQHVSGDKRG